MKDEIRSHGSMDDEIGRSCGTWYGTLVDLDGRGFTVGFKCLIAALLSAVHQAREYLCITWRRADPFATPIYMRMAHAHAIRLLSDLLHGRTARILIPIWPQEGARLRGRGAYTVVYSLEHTRSMDA